MSKPRKIGYYWVKFGGIWHSAFFIGTGWWVAGGTGLLTDKDFDKISKRKLEEPSLASISKAQYFLAGVFASATLLAILDLIMHGI